MMYLWPVSPIFKPLQAVDSSGSWPVLQTNPTSVATVCELLQDVLVIELSRTVRLITIRNLHRSCAHSLAVCLHTNARTPINGSFLANSRLISCSCPWVLFSRCSKEEFMRINITRFYRKNNRVKALKETQNNGHNHGNHHLLASSVLGPLIPEECGIHQVIYHLGPVFIQRLGRLNWRTAGGKTTSE